MKRKNIFLIFLLLHMAGCETQAHLTVYTQPEGAFITEKDTGKSFGAAPVTLFYDPFVLESHKDQGGCYLVKGFEARWVSGVVSSLDTIKLCGSNTGSYTITFSRDASQPGLDKDMQFALQLQAIRARQEQAQAAKDAAAAALFSAYQSSKELNCTSTQVGTIVTTKCK